MCWLTLRPVYQGGQRIDFDNCDPHCGDVAWWLRALARDNWTMAIIGNGAQSEFKLWLSIICSVSKLSICNDIDSAATDKIGSQFDAWALRPSVLPAPRSGQRRDIITTVTADKTNATIITPRHDPDQVCTSMVLVAIAQVNRNPC